MNQRKKEEEKEIVRRKKGILKNKNLGVRRERYPCETKAIDEGRSQRQEKCATFHSRNQRDWQDPFAGSDHLHEYLACQYTTMMVIKTYEEYNGK
jgi:hypothetical protein